jgi:hypothetical protein
MLILAIIYLILGIIAATMQFCMVAAKFNKKQYTTACNIFADTIVFIMVLVGWPFFLGAWLANLGGRLDDKKPKA